MKKTLIALLSLSAVPALANPNLDATRAISAFLGLQAGNSIALVGSTQELFPKACRLDASLASGEVNLYLFSKAFFERAESIAVSESGTVARTLDVRVDRIAVEPNRVAIEATSRVIVNGIVRQERLELARSGGRIAVRIGFRGVTYANDHGELQCVFKQ